MAQSRLTPLGDDTLHRPRRESETSVRSKPKSKVPFTPGKRDARPLGIQPSCVPCDPSDMYRESVRPRGMDTSHCPKIPLDSLNADRRQSVRTKGMDSLPNIPSDSLTTDRQDVRTPLQGKTMEGDSSGKLWNRDKGEHLDGVVDLPIAPKGCLNHFDPIYLKSTAKKKKDKTETDILDTKEVNESG